MHLSHAGGSALAFTDALDDSEGFFVDDRLVGVLEDLPFRRVILELLLLLVGFALCLEVHSVSEILLSG